MIPYRLSHQRYRLCCFIPICTFGHLSVIVFFLWLWLAYVYAALVISAILKMVFLKTMTALRNTEALRKEWQMFGGDLGALADVITRIKRLSDGV